MDKLCDFWGGVSLFIVFFGGGSPMPSCRDSPFIPPLGSSAPSQRQEGNRKALTSPRHPCHPRGNSEWPQNIKPTKSSIPIHICIYTDTDPGLSKKERKTNPKMPQTPLCEFSPTTWQH